MNSSQYVLITAARNEEDHIAETIKSVVSQTAPPMEWVIVSDGSTDRTDDIVREFANRFGFIKLLRNDAASQRTFASKARAIRAGYEQVRAIKHDYVGILDADVSFGPSYYENILRRFEEDGRLGIAGGVLLDRKGAKYVRQLTSTEWSVSGPIQMFRRRCFEDIGGYLPVRSGVDAVAEVMARMHGWLVKAFPEVVALHHRGTGTLGTGVLKRFFRFGRQNHRIGYHFLFFLGRCLCRSMEKPYLVGSAVALSGYCWSWIIGTPHDVPREFVNYLRAEQMSRIRSALTLKSLPGDIGRGGARSTVSIKK